MGETRVAQCAELRPEVVIVEGLLRSGRTHRAGRGIGGFKDRIPSREREVRLETPSRAAASTWERLFAGAKPGGLLSSLL